MATKRTVVNGSHRSESLALEHLRRLQSENPSATVRIIARRNADGHFSAHGRQFQFEVISQAPKEDLEDFFDAYDDAIDYEDQEWESAADYHNGE